MIFERDHCATYSAAEVVFVVFAAIELPKRPVRDRPEHAARRFSVGGERRSEFLRRTDAERLVAEVAQERSDGFGNIGTPGLGDGVEQSLRLLPVPPRSREAIPSKASL